jgi:nucleoid DNA-binding protein
MARKLTPKEFYDIVRKQAGVSEKVARDVWEAIVDISVKELQEYSAISFPYFGELIGDLKGGKYDYVPIPEKGAGTREVFVPPYIKLRFKPKESLKSRVNGKLPTRGDVYKFREKAKRDLMLEKEKEKQAEIFKKKSEELTHLREKRLAKYTKRMDVERADRENKKKDKKENDE